MDWKLFLSTFGLIFIAELPDKTAIATLLLAARHGALPVFCGVAGAFVVQTIIAVVFGSALSLMPPKIVHSLAGALFLIFAFMMWREKKEEQASDFVDKEEKKPGRDFWKIASKAFVVIFIAEWGDLTQLATATLQAKYHETLTIFLAAILALWTVTALGTFIGHHARKAIHPERLQKIAAVVFAIVGIVFLVRL